MLPTPSSPALALRQYTKDVPPGWRPRAYPIKDYRDALAVWARLTKLDQEQIGAAIMSRLEGGALRIAHGLTTVRLDPDSLTPVNYQGIDAVSLLASQAVTDQTGNEVVPAYPSGAKLLVD